MDFNFNYKDYNDEFIKVITLTVIFIMLYLITTFILKKVLLREIKSVIFTKAIKKAIKLIMLLIYIIIIMSIFDIPTTSLIASLSVIGIAIGIGSQKLIEDIIAGFFLITEDHFDIGDIIEVNDFRGEVIYIGLRIVKIKKYSGEIMIVENRNLSNVINYSTNYSLVEIDFPISYDHDFNEIKELTLSFIDNLKYENTLETPKIYDVSEFDKFNYFIKIMFKVKSGYEFEIKRKFNKDLMAFLNSKNIKMPVSKIII